MNAEWKEFSGELPRALIGLGTIPVHHQNAWWAKRDGDGSIMRVGMGDLASEQAAATAMNNALLAHGYRMSDQPLYMAFQTQEGLTADGFPGTNTMTALKDVLFTMGVEIAPVTVYPWLSSGGYDGTNAPPLSQWNPNGSSTAVTNIDNTSVSTTLFGLPEWAVWVLGATVVGGAGLILWSLLSKPGSKELHHHSVTHISHARKLRHAAESAAREERKRPSKKRKAKRSRRKSKRSRR
jgi:hypothetical protein